MAGAAPLPNAVEQAAESAETDVCTREHALAHQNGQEQEQELESLRQLRLSDDSPAAAADAAASASQSTASVEVRSGAQPAMSQTAYSSRARPDEQTPYAQPSVAVPDGEYRDSENVLHMEEGTPSSRTLPVPHVQRGPLSPLPGSSNLHNQPAGPQVTTDLQALQIRMLCPTLNDSVLACNQLLMWTASMHNQHPWLSDAMQRWQALMHVRL